MRPDDFTLEEILEEQRQQRERSLPAGAEYVEVEPEELSAETGFYAPMTQEEPAYQEASLPQPQSPAEEKPAAPPPAPQNMQNTQSPQTPQKQPAPQPEPQPPVQEPPLPEPESSPEPEPEKAKKKKKKRRSLFSWRKKVPDFDENEDDMYYGIQLKPIDEYRLDGEAPPLGEEGYKALFDDSMSIDGEVEENFQRLQQERRRRVAEAVQSVGMDEEQIADEFGVAAPAPVTSFAADPYAQQHGLAPEGAAAQGEIADLQRAMLEGSQTMELKLNVLNSTIELQKIEDSQAVSEDVVEEILASAAAQRLEHSEPVGTYQEAPQPPQAEYTPREPAAGQRPEYSEPVSTYQEAPQTPQAEYVPREPAAGQRPEYSKPVNPYREAPQPPQAEYTPREPAAGQRPEYSEPVGTYQEVPQPPQAEYSEPVGTYQEAPQPPQAEYAPQRPPEPEPVRAYREEPQQAAPPQPPQEKTRELSQEEMAAMRAARQDKQAQQEAGAAPRPEPPRPVQEVPYVNNIFEYRSRNIPTHIINADALQSAILSESESLQRLKDMAEGKPAPRRRPRKKPDEDLPEAPPPAENTGESIDDYTGPEDARSISNELRGEMHGLSLRMMITGACTVLLALVSIVCRSRFSPKGSDSWPLAYVVLSLVFLVVAVGMCYKTVGGGLKALFTAKTSSDSGVAIAAAAALVQTVSAIFFRDRLAEGGLHLYAMVVSGLLFLNTAGKLTLIRRIHSNFRFLASREDKYAVRLFDDYNTSLKMTKDCVAEKPLIAYQCRTGFLKRFLELSYLPDPSESASQTLAPLGLLASLCLCVACLLITKDVPSSIGAFTAACTASVAAANMLSVNLPVSNMCKTIRRAGGMAVGYEAVERLGDVNAVIADAGELFPTGTVKLDGIKTFGARMFSEEAIMAASALMREVGGPLTGVFDQVISENEDVLPQVEKFTYESGAGVVGRVDGRTVYIGNRGLLINHRLEAPSREEETQYASGSKNLIYIAVDAQVAALLVLSYAADRRRKNELQRLEDSGISVLVRTTDPNVTVALVSRLFGIDSASVGILDGPLGETAQSLIGETVPRADALAATKGRMESLMSLVAACVEQKRTAGILVAIQTTAAILGFVLVAALSCFNSVSTLSALILFVYQLFFVAVLTILPRFRR